jgi:hypothetical protein
MANTAIYGVQKPTVAGDSGVWGGELNTGLDTWDNEIARSRVPFITPTYNVGGTTTLDLNQTTGGRVFVFTVSGASTLAFSNVPSASFAVRIRLLITNGAAFVLTFPASVTWLSRVAPTFNVAGVDEVELMTLDGGTTWYGSLRGPRAGVLYLNQALTTTSTSDVSLASYTLPANTLTVNGQALRVTIMGVTATQTCTVHPKFGAQDITNTTVVAGNRFRLYHHIVRTGAATQGSTNELLNGTVISSGRVTPAETLSGPVVIDFRGSVTAGGTLTYDFIVVELLAVA